MILENQGWSFSQLPYARYKASKDHTTVAAYESGKLVVQGRGTEELVLYIIEPQILGSFGFGYDLTDSGTTGTAAVQEEIITPHGGIDESGKGDFFGPLVIAGVCVDETSAAELQKLGVCDSKLIHSSAKITKLAEAIRSITATIPPRIMGAARSNSSLSPAPIISVKIKVMICMPKEMIILTA